MHHVIRQAWRGGGGGGSEERCRDSPDKLLLPLQLTLQTCTSPRPRELRATAGSNLSPRGPRPEHTASARGFGRPRCKRRSRCRRRSPRRQCRAPRRGHSPTPGTPAWPRSPARSSAARGARTRAGGAAAPGPRGSPRSWWAAGRGAGGRTAAREGKLRPLQSPWRDGRLYLRGRGWGAGGAGGVARWARGAGGGGQPQGKLPGDGAPARGPARPAPPLRPHTAQARGEAALAATAGTWTLIKCFVSM